MERSRYSFKPNVGKGLNRFITNFNIAGEFDLAWLDSNPNFLGADLPIKTHAELRFQR